MKDESDEEDTVKPLTEDTELAMATIAAAAAVLNLIVAGSCLWFQFHHCSIHLGGFLSRVWFCGARSKGEEQTAS